jgi:hypothetical protein
LGKSLQTSLVRWLRGPTLYSPVHVCASVCMTSAAGAGSTLVPSDAARSPEAEATRLGSDGTALDPDKTLTGCSRPRAGRRGAKWAGCIAPTQARGLGGSWWRCCVCRRGWSRPGPGDLGVRVVCSGRRRGRRRRSLHAGRRAALTGQFALDTYYSLAPAHSRSTSDRFCSRGQYGHTVSIDLQNLIECGRRYLAWANAPRTNVQKG